MADRISLVITLRKDVPDEPTAKALLDIVKTRMADNPTVIVTGKMVQHYDALPDPP